MLALIARTPPNPVPFATLLRGGGDIPAGIREALAELLDPGEPSLYDLKLVTEETRKTKKQNDDWLLSLATAAKYDRLQTERATNIAQAFSVETAGGTKHITERTVYRYRRYWNDLYSRLKGG